MSVWFFLAILCTVICGSVLFRAYRTGRLLYRIDYDLTRNPTAFWVGVVSYLLLIGVAWWGFIRNGF
jgi:hypothetical protein